MKKITKKIYAILLIILMLINYMPVISRAVEYNMILALESTASRYVEGDEILVDIKVCELKEIGDIVQFAAKIEYNHNDLDLVDMIVTEEGYGVEKNIAESVIVVSKSMGEGTIGEGDIVATLKFNAKKSSETKTTIKLTEIDSTCNSGDVYFDDVNEPEITLPVESLHSLKITKTDTSGEAIQNNSALFKVEDLNGQKIYIETAEDGTAVIDNLKISNSEGPYIYKIKEIVAPTGYVLNEEETSVTVTFNQNGTISGVDTNNGIAGIIEETNTIDIKISNEAEIIKPKQEVFNLVLNKVNEEGQSITGSTAEFSITMPDGTTAEYSTNIETGKTQNIPLIAPETEGTYAYIIKENKAPEGYIVENNNIIALLTFEEQENTIVLVSANILSETSEEILPEVQDETKTITLNIKNNQEIIKYDYTISIDKVKNDTFNSNITEGTAIFEITKEDETQYIKTNALGKATFNFSMTNKQIKENNECTYTIKEIKAPEGYILDEEVKSITLTFNDDGTINDARVSGDNIEKISLTQNNANVRIVNNEKEVETPLVPENFNLEINKVDEQGNLITTDTASFILTKPDGARNAYTTEQGKIENIELQAPNTLEKQIYFIQETKAPEGYNILNESLVIEMNYIESEGKVVLSSAIVKDNNETITPIVKNEEQTLILNIENTKKEETIPTQKFNIQINGVNRENEAIEDGTTVLKITDKVTNEVIYKEVPINNGKIELEMPAIEGTKQYEVEQIKAPEGYELNKNKITIEVEFEKNTEDKLEIKDYTVQGTDSKKGETQEKDIISVIIINEEIVVEPQKQNYSIEINKLDSETRKPITTSPAVFTLITYDAKIKDYVTTNGQTTINDLVPLKAGEEAIYVIKEKTAPEGYKPVEKSIVIKVSFEEQNGLINVANSQILLGEELATVEVLENTIKLNILNEKEEDEDLYVVSRKYEDGTDIYDLFTTYTGRHYTINSPFIDTKVAKLGNNITIQEFINNLESNGEMRVYDEQGNLIHNSERVKTKMILKATKGKQELTFTIVIKGDSDGDGRVRTKDLDMLIKHIAVEKVLTDPIELRALDLVVEPGDGIIRTTDLNRYYKIIAREEI